MKVTFAFNKLNNRKFNKLPVLPLQFIKTKSPVDITIKTSIPAATVLSLMFVNKQLNQKTSPNIIGKAHIESFLLENPEIKEEDFKNYLKGINIEGINRIAPLTKDYDTKAWFDFASVHYLMGTKDFSKKSLTLPTDLTSLLSNKPLLGHLYTLLNAFPNTNRQIGVLPKDWISEGDTDVKIDVLNNIIENFRENVNNRKKMLPEDVVRECEIFSKKLSEVINKKAVVSPLDVGSHSFVYKIDIEGAKPKVIKIFNKGGCIAMDHGVYAEVPRGLFLNKNFPDRFAQFYYGKVSHSYKNDGYMISEFLETGGNVCVESFFENDKYEVECSDVGFGYNVAQGKIFDFGGIYIYPKEVKNLKSILKEL